MPANRLRLPAADSTPRFPYSCPADERGRDLSEYDDNGHYRAGPKLAQPTGLTAMIAARAASAPPDLKRAAAEQAIAAERTAYRQQLPIPVLATLAATRRQRRHGLGTSGVVRPARGYAALLAAVRSAA